MFVYACVFSCERKREAGGGGGGGGGGRRREGVFSITMQPLSLSHSYQITKPGAGSINDYFPTTPTLLLQKKRENNHVLYNNYTMRKNAMCTCNCVCKKGSKVEKTVRGRWG